MRADLGVLLVDIETYLIIRGAQFVG